MFCFGTNATCALPTTLRCRWRRASGMSWRSMWSNPPIGRCLIHPRDSGQRQPTPLAICATIWAVSAARWSCVSVMRWTSWPGCAASTPSPGSSATRKPATCGPMRATVASRPGPGRPESRGTRWRSPVWSGDCADATDGPVSVTPSCAARSRCHRRSVSCRGSRRVRSRPPGHCNSQMTPARIGKAAAAFTDLPHWTAF